MDFTHAHIHALQSAAVAITRLDDGVRIAGANAALPTLLMLRSAQAIVAREDRPSSPAGLSAESEFAALVGWWYAPESREFITVDATLCAGAERLRLLETAAPQAQASDRTLPNVMRETASTAAREGWSSLELSGALHAGPCAAASGVDAALARAAGLVGTELLSGAYVAAPTATDMVGAWHGIAREARVMARRVEAYRASCLSAESRCRSFGRGAATAHAVVDLLAQRPALTVADVVAAVRVATPTAGAALERLLAVGVVREITGRGRDRLFVYAPAVALAG